MTAPEIIQIITALTTLIGVIGGIFVSLRNGQRTSEVSAKVEEIHKSTNSMKDELVKVTGEAAHSAGKEEERIEERARQANP